MFPNLSTLLIGVSRGVGQLLGNELDVVVTDHQLKLRFVNPEKSDAEGVQWDESHFTRGNIHYKGFANPIKPERPDEADREGGVEYVTSEKYKTYMRNKLIKDIIAEATEGTGLTLLHVLVLLATVQFSTTAILLWFIL